MSWLMDFFRQLRRDDPRPPTVDTEAIRQQMLRDDPEYGRIRRAQHDHAQPLAARALADGIALRAEREFWERNRVDP